MPITDSRKLKQVSLEFRNLASRALRSNEEDARVNLRRLLAFVNDTPLLRAEIDRAPTPSGDVMEFWTNIREQRRRLEIPDDPLEELGLLHALLTEFAKPSKDRFWDIAFFYGGSSNYKECVAQVLHDTCGRYEGHLRGVIELALLNSDDVAYDSRRIEVRLSGGNNQVNVAQDSGRIDAHQAVGAELGEIARLANALALAAAEAAQNTGHAGATELEDVAVAVAQAVRSPHPNRFTLRAAKENLQLFAATANAVHALAPYGATLASHAQQLAAIVGEFLSKAPQ